MRLKTMLFGTALAFAIPAAPALAQGAITVGMQVTDAKGGPVGTVTAIQGDNIKVKTDKLDALLPKASFAVSDGKLLIGMTQAELDAAIEKSLAAADASVKAGATVNGPNGAAVGTIDSVTADGVAIKLLSGKMVQVPRTGVRGNADGTVTIGVTADELEAQLKQAGTKGSR